MAIEMVPSDLMTDPTETRETSAPDSSTLTTPDLLALSTTLATLNRLERWVISNQRALAAAHLSPATVYGLANEALEKVFSGLNDVIARPYLYRPQEDTKTQP